MLETLTATSFVVRPASSVARFRSRIRATTRSGARRPQVAASRASAEGGGALTSKRLPTDDGYNCVITEDGVIVADDIPSGTYEVSAWWAANGSTDEEEEAAGQHAPRCSSEQQRGCEVKCELVADGCLVCEGLTEGKYKVVNAAEYNTECKVTDDMQSIECEGTEPLVQDTGDIDLKDSGTHGIRLGG